MDPSDGDVIAIHIERTKLDAKLSQPVVCDLKVDYLGLRDGDMFEAEAAAGATDPDSKKKSKKVAPKELRNINKVIRDAFTPITEEGYDLPGAIRLLAPFNIEAIIL